MGKPRMIILIRHGQSEGNKNRDIHQMIPDHRVQLTPEGWSQAHDAGHRLRSLLRADDTLHFFTSPYRRARETTEGILTTLTSDDPSPSPFPRHAIKVYEEPRLREQDFGNFQPCSDEMERMWQERADYGHFFYRIPNGESAADAYDRISGFNESLWRQFGEEDCASVCVLVTHGLMSRVFLMKWYHFSVEYFEDLRNINHCEFLIMRKKDDSGKYILENNLRTWSELKRARLVAVKEKEKNGTGSPQSQASAKDREKEKKLLGEGGAISATSSSVPLRKKWGGCPNGCNHSKHAYLKKEILAVSSSPPRAQRWPSWSGSEDDEEAQRIRREAAAFVLKGSVTHGNGNDKGSGESEGELKAADARILSVRSAGRDFGGSASGNTSVAESGSETEDGRRAAAAAYRRKKSNGLGNGNGHGAGGGGVKLGSGLADGGRRERRLISSASGMGRGAMADPLGDQSDMASEADGENGGNEDDDEDDDDDDEDDGPEEGGEEKEDKIKDIVDAEKKESSIMGSVY